MHYTYILNYKTFTVYFNVFSQYLRTYLRLCVRSHLFCESTTEQRAKIANAEICICLLFSIIKPHVIYLGRCAYEANVGGPLSFASGSSISPWNTKNLWLVINMKLPWYVVSYLFHTESVYSWNLFHIGWSTWRFRTTVICGIVTYVVSRGAVEFGTQCYELFESRTIFQRCVLLVNHDMQ